MDFQGRGGMKSKANKPKPKSKKQPKDKVYIGPNGGKYVIRNGKKVYTAMIGRAERMFTSMFGDPSKTASENNVPASFVTYNRMLYSPDWNPTPDKNVARKFKEYLKKNIKSKFDREHTDFVLAYLHKIKTWEAYNDPKELNKRIRALISAQGK